MDHGTGISLAKPLLERLGRRQAISCGPIREGHERVVVAGIEDEDRSHGYSGPPS